MNLKALWDECLQYQYKNGAILSNGKVYVYFRGRTEPATTYANIEGTENTFPIILDNNGRANCYVNDAFAYTIVVCDQYNKELFSVDKLPSDSGSAVITTPNTNITSSDDSLEVTTTYNQFTNTNTFDLSVKGNEINYRRCASWPITTASQFPVVEVTGKGGTGNNISFSNGKIVVKKGYYHLDLTFNLNHEALRDVVENQIITVNDNSCYVELDLSKSEQLSCNLGCDIYAPADDTEITIAMAQMSDGVTSIIHNGCIYQIVTAGTSTIEGDVTKAYVDQQDGLLGARIDQLVIDINDLRDDLLDEVEDRENADEALSNRIDCKQDKLTAGDHIEITEDNTINVVGEFGNTYTSPNGTIIVDNTNSTLEATKYYIEDARTATRYTIGSYVEGENISITSDKIAFDIEEATTNKFVGIEYRMYNEDGTSIPMTLSIQGSQLDGEITIPTNAFDKGLDVSYIKILSASTEITENENDKLITYSPYTATKKEVQEKLVAGDNIGIADDGKTISVVDKKELHVASPITWDADTTTIGFDDSAYAKTSDIPTDFYTKAQTDSAISSAVADKVTTSELNTVEGTLETSIGEVERQVISVANTLSTNYYTKTQVDGFLQNWSGFVVVPLGEELPAASEAQLGKIYLWKKADAQEKDNYEEWISDGTAWSKIGSMEIDLSNYFTKTEIEENYATLGDITRVEAAVNDKLDKVEVDGITITGDGTTDNPLKATADIGETYTLEAEGPHGSGDITYIKITDDTTNKKTLLGLTDAAKQAIAAGVAKQDKLTAGDGINISNSDVISCTLPKTITWSGDDQVIIPAGKKWSGMLSIILQPSTAKGAGAYCGPRHPDNGISMLVVWPAIDESMVTGYNWYCQTIAFEYDNRNGTTDKTWEFTRSGVLAEEVHTMFVGIEE